MQLKNYKELLSLTDEHLNKERSKITKELSIINFENSQGNYRDTSEIRKLKKYLAQMETITRQRETEQKNQNSLSK